MGLLLNQLCVLETHDQLEFLLLHTGNLRLVKVLLILLANEALLNLGASAILFFDEVHLALGHGLLLLHLDHVLDLLGTVNLTVFIVVPLLPDHLLFTLGLHRLLLCLQVSHLLVLVDLLIVLLLDIQVHLGLLTLLLHLLLLSHQLLLLQFHVATTLAHNVSGTFPRLVNFLDCLLKETITRPLYLLCALQISTDRFCCREASSPLQHACEPFWRPQTYGVKLHHHPLRMG